MTPTPHQAALILNGLPGVGPVACRKLFSAFDGDLVAALHASEKQLASVPGIGKTLAGKIRDRQKIFDLEKEERALVAHDARFIPFFDAAFPPLLKEIPDPPVGLYVRGNIEALTSKKTVAIIGTRKASLYGIGNAKKIAGELAVAGQIIVSGGARGIDTAAHEAVLDTSGTTFCVLGCGLDIVYPPENFELFKKITRQGGVVLSEFPFGKKADKRTFPQRNRIIAGISAGTLVVESEIAGGSIITANFAADYGRTVFALPGRVEQPGSRGCHKLIREGATLITGASDLLEDLTGTPVQTLLPLAEATDESAAPSRAHSAEAQKILSLLMCGEALSPDSIAERTSLPFPLVSATLLLLELDGLAARKADGCYEIS